MLPKVQRTIDAMRNSCTMDSPTISGCSLRIAAPYGGHGGIVEHIRTVGMPHGEDVPRVRVARARGLEYRLGGPSQFGRGVGCVACGGVAVFGDYTGAEGPPTGTRMKLRRSGWQANHGIS